MYAFKSLLITLHHTLQHLDSSRTDVRILDGSSVFNTICPRKLNEKLTNLGVPPPTCNWNLDFMTERPPVVRMGRQVSAELTVSTKHSTAAVSAPNSLTFTQMTVCTWVDCQRLSTQLSPCSGTNTAHTT